MGSGRAGTLCVRVRYRKAVRPLWGPAMGAGCASQRDPQGRRHRVQGRRRWGQGRRRSGGPRLVPLRDGGRAAESIARSTDPEPDADQALIRARQVLDACSRVLPGMWCVADARGQRRAGAHPNCGLTGTQPWWGRGVCLNALTEDLHRGNTELRASFLTHHHPSPLGAARGRDARGGGCSLARDGLQDQAQGEVISGHYRYSDRDIFAQCTVLLVKTVGSIF